MVCIHAGATAGVAWSVQCLPGRPDLCTCVSVMEHLAPSVVFSPSTEPLKHTKLGGCRLESGADSKGSTVDMGACFGASSQECDHWSVSSDGGLLQQAALNRWWPRRLQSPKLDIVFQTVPVKAVIHTIPMLQL